MHRLMWLVLVLLQFGTGLSASSASAPRVVPGYEGPPAWMEIFVKRVAPSDTLLVLASIGLDPSSPSYGQRGEWRVSLPTGMSLLQGPSEMRGTKQEIHARHELLVRCERWGTFEIRGKLTVHHDSLNWTADEVAATVRVTADSFEVLEYPYPHGHVGGAWVVDGLYYVRQDIMWIPLDPGEEAAVEPGFRRHTVATPPTLHAEPATRTRAAGPDSGYEVPIFVAVDRAGQVKAVRLNYGGVRIPRDVLEAALAAAWKWRFAPAQSLGRPVSTLYLIKVPVGGVRKDK